MVVASKRVSRSRALKGANGQRMMVLAIRIPVVDAKDRFEDFNPRRKGKQLG